MGQCAWLNHTRMTHLGQRAQCASQPKVRKKTGRPLLFFGRPLFKSGRPEEKPDVRFLETGRCRKSGRPEKMSDVRFLSR